MLTIENILSGNIWSSAALKISKKITESYNQKKRTLLLLSGGSAISIYHELADITENLESGKDYLALAQIDDRFNPPDSSQINSLAIENSKLPEKLQARGIPFYKIPQTGTMRETAFNYDKLLKKLFGIYDFKFAVLGLGHDGHTAGILRGYKDEWDKDRMVVAYENRGEFPVRITITPKVFVQLDYGLIAVTGIEKQRALERVVNKESDDINNLPGLLIHKIKDIEIITDLEIHKKA